MKDHVPQKQYAPAVRTEFVQRGIRLVAGLTDLAALRLITAFQPALLKLHIVDAAPLLRVNLLGEIHSLLLKQNRQCNDNQKNRQQWNHGAVDLLRQINDSGIEKEEAGDHRQAVQQQRQAQALLCALNDVLVFAIPAAEGGSGTAVLVESAAQQHGGA